MSKVRVIDQGFIAHVEFMEMLFGTGVKPSFEGKLLAINPTREEFATFDENFAGAVADGQVPEPIVEGLVYYDNGAERAYILGEDMVEIIEE